ncbi:MAG: hypothetical protein Q4E76_01825 [Tissierellia bacterium]|nr:hypothetical protein [Tissierellia bacterium]
MLGTKQPNNILILHDRVMEFMVYQQGQKIHGETLSIPPHVLEDGKIMDSPHLQYLIRRIIGEEYQGNGLTLFVASSAIKTRAITSPKLTLEEYASLAENQLGEIFLQDLEDYFWDHTVLEGEEESILLVSLLPKELSREWNLLLEKEEARSRRLLPLANLYLTFAFNEGGGKLFEVNETTYGFHYGHQQRFYSRSLPSDDLGDFLEKQRMEHHLIMDRLRAQPETVGFDGEFERGFLARVNEIFQKITRMAQGFDSQVPVYLVGSFSQMGLWDYLTISGEEGNVKSTTADELVASSLEHPPLRAMNFAQKQGRSLGLGGIPMIPLVIGLLSLVLLGGSFLYGEKLKRGNQDLENQELAMTEILPQSPPENNSEKIAATMEIIQDLATEDITISSVNYQGGITEINGQATDQEALEQWLDDLEWALEAQVELEPPTDINGLLYFRCTINEGEINV